MNQTSLTGGFKYGAYIGELHLLQKGVALDSNFSDKMIARGLKEISALFERRSGTPHSAHSVKNLVSFLARSDDDVRSFGSIYLYGSL